MDAKVIAVLAPVLAAVCLSDGEYARLRRRGRRRAPRSAPGANPVRIALPWVGWAGAALKPA